MAKSIREYFLGKIKRALLRRRGVIVYHDSVVERVKFLGSAIVEPYCRLIGDPKIVVGSDFYLNVGCHFLGDITIGDNVLIGPKTIIWGRDHGSKLSSPMRYQPHVKKPIIIGDDVWIGANVTILKGVEIGSGSIIAAGAVVVKNVPRFSVVAGNPAKVIKLRTESNAGV